MKINFFVVVEEGGYFILLLFIFCIMSCFTVEVQTKDGIESFSYDVEIGDKKIKLATLVASGKVNMTGKKVVSNHQSWTWISAGDRVILMYKE